MNKEGINLGESQESPESIKEKLLEDVDKSANVLNVDIKNLIARVRDIEPRKANDKLSWLKDRLNNFLEDLEQEMLVRG